jgi:formylglycine-generating enzyme required for sulfatase activity
MKSEKDLDRLFDTLRKQPPIISVDEISHDFRTYADTNIRKTQLKKSQVFTLKIFLVMMTLITLFTIPALIVNSNKELNPLANGTCAVENRSQQILSEATLGLYESDTSSFLSYRTPVYNEQSYQEYNYLQPTITSDSSEQVSGPFTNFIHKEVEGQPYVFPKLSDDEVESNHKQKRNMLKALEKTDKNSYLFIPSGVLKNGDSSVSINAFYMQRNEVTNLEYRTFLFDLLIQDRKDDFLKAKPDQSKWTQLPGDWYNVPMEQQYFSHPAYNDYPVVNVSREGAELYCQWLFTETNKFLRDKKKPEIQKVRLPFRSEWIYAASAGGKTMKYPWVGDHMQNSAGCYLANFRPSKDNYHEDGGFYTVKVSSYLPNEFGLFNMSGNVAEMVYNDTSAKSFGTAGGGWMSSEQELQLNGTDLHANLTDGHPNVGFRVVFSVL